MNAMTSLCRFCTTPNTCPLCDLIRNPRTLTTASIQRIARTFVPMSVTAIAPAPRHSPVAVAPDATAELRRQVEAERARNEALKRAANVYGRKLASVTNTPAPRATPPRPASLVPETATDKVPAYVPTPTVNLSAPLAVRDWAGLSARVDAGVLSQSDAERIGAEWLKGGAPTIKA